MKWKPYPKYKDSGVEWLGMVPEHWDVVKLRRVALSVDTGSTPALDSFCGEDAESQDCIPWYTPSDFGLNLTLCNSSKRLKRNIAIQNKWKIFPSGSVMIVGIGSIGNVGLLNADASANQQINVIVPITNKIDGHFLVYTLAAKKDDMLRLSNVTILRIINQNKTKEIWLELPPLPEQRAIAAFLNAETARIDSLIADYESLIDLLREERQAIVAHAVTKGLNPDAPMKDSGVEWLGMVPEHWGCQKLRRVAKHVDTGSTPSGTISSDEEPDGIPWYTPGDLPDDIILSKSSKVLGQSDSDDNEAKLFPAGCVMVVSIGATLGKVGYTVMDSSANQQINIVWPDTSVIFGRFLAYSLSVKKENMLYMANSSTIGIMNQEKTKEIWLAIPPLPEQHAIAEYLDAETARIDGLIADAERAIELLRESRAALITDAVTGKMDVRDWQKECA